MNNLKLSQMIEQLKKTEKTSSLSIEDICGINAKIPIKISEKRKLLIKKERRLIRLKIIMPNKTPINIPPL